METIRKDNIPDSLISFPLVLYGAGFAGRQCRKILKEKSIDAVFFVDDDRTKWGKQIEELTVLSFEELKTFCHEKRRVNVILTSIYGIQIAKKLEKIENVHIFEMYDWYTEIVMPERFGEQIYDAESLEEYKKRTDLLKGYLQDEESCQVFENLYQYMITGDINYISEISTSEEQYFIKEVHSYLGDKPFTIVDAGAYEGELIRPILEMGLNVREWYCFETNKENYCQLLKNSSGNHFSGRQICVKKGLWNENASLCVIGNGTSSKVVGEEDGENMVEMTFIDDYFQEIPIDLIKMDIEGAEYNALKGGLKTIKRDRPVLAISIYHSIEDYYKIMELLTQNLEDYEFYVRHHSMVFCETVLYAIPQKRTGL